MSKYGLTIYSYVLYEYTSFPIPAPGLLLPPLQAHICCWFKGLQILPRGGNPDPSVKNPPQHQAQYVFMLVLKFFFSFVIV